MLFLTIYIFQSDVEYLCQIATKVHLTIDAAKKSRNFSALKADVETVRLHAASLEIFLLVLFFQHNEQNSGSDASRPGGMGDRFSKTGASGMDFNYSWNR